MSRATMLRKERELAKKLTQLEVKENDPNFDTLYKKKLNEIRDAREKIESDKIKQRPKSPKRPSPPKKPLVKPKPVEEIEIRKLNIEVKSAIPEYLIKLKKKVDSLDSDNYSVETLEKDIGKDSFIQSAIDAQKEALNYKLVTYQKLAKIKWQVEEEREDHKSEININLNKMINSIIQEVKLNLIKLPSIRQKRDELLNILYDPMNGIVTLRGSSRENVRLFLIKTIYMFIKVPSFFFNGFINFMLTGSAGSGKTKLANVIAYTMQNLGILIRKNVMVVTKQNLVGQFVGQSGPKTRQVLSQSIEGVLFIDEAYTLTPCKDEKDSAGFSSESVGELINFIDKFIGCIIVIVAGYKDKMNDCFLQFNEGMSRRFPKIIDLNPYSGSDLFQLFETFLSDSININKLLTKDQRIYINSMINALAEKDVFNNQAGDMLNLSKTIGEDAVLYSGKYSDKMILLSFKKFCATKGLEIHLE